MTHHAIVLDEIVCGKDASWSGLDLSLQVDIGEYLAIIGPSRSGKSVLIELCAGLVSPLSGRVEVLGSEWASPSATDHLELRLRIGTVLQQPGLLSNMTVYNNVSLPFRYHRATVNEKERHERVMGHLDALHLTHVRDQFPAQLTPGESRCAAVARAMMLDPELLLLDDAVAGLDAHMVGRVWSYLSYCRTKYPLTILATLRGPSLFEQADRIAILREGRLEAIGDRESVLAGASPEMKTFLVRSR